MKLKSLVIISVLLFNFCFFTNAQEEQQNQFNVSMQLRPRAEYRNGYKTPLTETDISTGFVNQRSRLSLDFQRQGLSAMLSLQNVSVWGEYPVSNVYESNTVIYEAWAKLKGQSGFFAKFGRQVLHYNDGRLLSVADWNQASRVHDALKFGYQTELNQLDLVLAYNQDADKNSGGTYYRAIGVPYKTMQALYYQNNSSEVFTPSFLFVNIGLEEGDAVAGDSKLANMQTLGTNLIYKPLPELRFQGNAFYQMGKRRNSDTKISAYMLTLRGDYDVTKQVRFTAGTDFLSGEEYRSPNSNDTYNAFNWLYAGNHGLYGVMDFFIDSPYRSGMNLGIWDKFLGVTYKANSKMSVGLTYHHFSTANEVYDQAGEKMNSGLGSEIDLQVDYNIMKDVRLLCGYSTFFGTPTMDYVKGGDHKHWQDWAFLSVVVNPRIFSAKW